MTDRIVAVSGFGLACLALGSFSLAFDGNDRVAMAGAFLGFLGFWVDATTSVRPGRYVQKRGSPFFVRDDP